MKASKEEPRDNAGQYVYCANCGYETDKEEVGAHCPECQEGKMEEHYYHLGGA